MSEIVEATVAHARELALKLRPADSAELAALELDPLQAILESMEQSEISLSVFFDGELGAIFGVRRVEDLSLAPSNVGVAWLLTTSAVETHRWTFMRLSRKVMTRFLESFERLVNAIDARNDAALRWARWLGAEVQPAVPYGPLGMPFHPFSVRRPQCA